MDPCIGTDLFSVALSQTLLNHGCEASALHDLPVYSQLLLGLIASFCIPWRYGQVNLIWVVDTKMIRT